MTTTTHTPLARLAFESNADAYAAYQAAADALTAENAAGVYGGPAFDAFMARGRIVYASALVLVTRRFVEPGDTVFTADGPLRVADVDDWTNVVMSADGGPVGSAWHDGESTGDPIQYQRWSDLDGCTAHGYADAESRRIVQTG